MPANQLTYDVKLNIAQARAEVNQLLRIFRSDLQNVTVPALDPQLFTNAIAETRVLASEFRQLTTQSQQFAQNMQQAQVAAQRQAQSAPRTGAAKGGKGLVDTAIKGVAGYLTIQGARQVFEAAQGFAELGTQVRRSEEAFAILSGGANIAEQRIQAIQRASGGTVDSLKAIEIGTQVTALGLAKTTEEFEKLTRAGRAIALVSPTIHDVGEALTQLSLFASNEASFARADQLGLSVKEVKDRMAELQSQNEGLDGSQAKLQASLELLEEKFGGVLDSGSAAASGIEKFKVAITEARNELAKGSFGQAVDEAFAGVAGVLQDTRVTFGGGDSAVLQESLKRQAAAQATLGAQSGSLFGGAYGDPKQAEQLQRSAEAYERFNKAVRDGVPGASEYQQAADGIVRSILSVGEASDEQIATLSRFAAESRAFAEDFSANTSPGVVAAIEQRNQQIEQAKELAQAFKDLDQLLATTGEFTPQQLPGIEQIQQALIALKSEIATTGTVTAEQAAAISQLESVLSGANSAVQFMATEEGRAAIATGQFNAELANTPGYLDAFKLHALQAVDAIGQAINIQTQLENSIQSSLSGLISRGLITAQQAQSIARQQQLQATQTAATIAGLPAEQQAFARAEAQYNLSAPVRQIEENDRLAKQAIREQEAAQKKAAGAAETAFKKAASEAEAAFKKAAAQLEGDLKSTPGLFGGSEITQNQLDLAAGGIPQNFADNFVRRLKDEVENGKDWEGVSIDMAREALGRVGIVASDNAETVVRQIAEAWSNSTLFSDPANLALIDQEAVQANLDLREKARLGQENILKHFGVVIDEAVEAATAAVSGGVAPPITPVAAPIIGPLPQFGQFADTGGTLNAPYIVPVTVAETAMSDVTSQLFAQLAAEQAGVEALGGVVGGMMEIGFLRYDLTPMASEFVSSIAANLAAQGDVIKGQGADYAGIVALGIAGYDFTSAAKSAMIGIRGGFGASENLDMAIGTGSAIMQFIIDGMGNKANEEGALDGLAATLFAKLLEAINEGV